MNMNSTILIYSYIFEKLKFVKIIFINSKCRFYDYEFLNSLLKSFKLGLLY